MLSSRAQHALPFLFILVLVACQNLPAQAPAGPPALPGAAAPQKPQFPDGDDALWQWLDERYARIPQGDAAAKVTAAERPMVFALVDGTIEGLLRHLNTYPKSPHRVAAIIDFCRLTQLNQARFLSAKMQEYKQNNVRPTRADVQMITRVYHSTVQRWVTEGLTLEPTPAERHRLLQISGDSYLRCGFHEKSAQAFAAALKAHPNGPDVDRLQFNLLDALDGAGDYDRCIAEGNRYLGNYEKWPRTMYAPHGFFVMHKALRHGGKLDEGLALWNKALPFLEAGADGEPMPGDADYIVPAERRMDFQKYRDRYDFYTGFYHFAAGHDELAKKHFQAYIDYIDALTQKVYAARKAAEEKGPEALANAPRMDMSTQAYRDHQALPYLTTLYGQIGKPAPPLRMTDEGWLVPPDTVEADESPRSSVIFFCPMKKDRYVKFFGVLQTLLAQHSKQGVQLIWISYPTTSRKEEFAQAQEELLLEAERLGLDNAALGFDVPRESPIHSDYHATRGSGDLYVVDAEGHLQWRIIDPMYWDAGLIASVLERVFPTTEESDEK